MTTDISISETETTISLSMRVNGDIDNMDDIRYRFQMLRDLIEAISSAEKTFFALPQAIRIKRKKAFAAHEMKCNAQVLIAIESGKILSSIADGTRKAEDTGFPEFSDD